MLFNTIVGAGDTYEVFQGAIFDLVPEYNGDRVRICPPVSINTSGNRLTPLRTVKVSHELLLSEDALMTSAGLTILRAGVRIGYETILVPESDAARCEVQHKAQAVWIPEPFRFHTDFRSIRGVSLVFSERPSLIRQILMPGLALLTEGDVLDVRFVQLHKRDEGMFKGARDVETLLKSFKVTFDGTNIKLDGVHTRLLPQESFV
jgi:hypothetical protein